MQLLKSITRKATASMKKKTLVNIFLRFFVLTMLLMVSSATIAVYSNYRMINDAKESNRNYLRAVSSTLDGLFNKLKDKGYSVASDSDFLNLVAMTDKSQKNYSSSSYELSNKLSDLYISDDVVDDAFIYFQNIHTILAGSGSYNPTFYFNLHYRYKDYPQAFWNNALASGSDSAIFSATDVMTQSGDSGEKRYKSIVPLLLNIESLAHARNYMIINIDEQKIYQLIDEMNITKKGEIYLVDTHHNRFISTTDRKMLGERFDAKTLRLNVTEGKTESTAKIGSERYMLSFQHSTWNNLGFLIVTPEHMLTGPTNNFLYWTIGVIVLFMLIGTFFSAIFTRGIYSPLADIVIQMKRFALSPFEHGGSEYEYIKENMTSLQQFHQESMPSLLQILLYRALNQQIDHADIDRLQQKYDFFRGGDRLAVVVVRVSFSARSERSPADLKRLLAGFNKPVLDISEHESVLFFQEHHAEDVHASVRRLGDLSAAFIEGEKDSVHLAVGMSPIFHQLEQTSQAYKEACAVLDWRSVNKAGILFTDADESRGSRASAYIAADKKEMLYKYMDHGNVEGSAHLLEQLLEEAHAQDMPFKSFKQLASDLLYLAVEIVYVRGIDGQSLFGMPADEVIPYIGTFQDPRIMESLCRDIYRALSVHIQNQLQSSKAIHGMLDYIAQHLPEANLTTIADRFNMNANYVSQYFKKQLGVTFTDYINGLRIDKAKELLIGSALTVNDVGKQVGFNNANAFIRMFKKLEAVTPNEYRKGSQAQHQQGPAERG
ncbi:YesN/AraC family two-component response regulator [Paenibacillus taihuensis]|uniref:YesN/AraC family two-component response regulator n=1 Tax=Paenibacillus taihuensis TaxID=1156355 RepID=A0A3D9R2W9_9BACL|nr:helix-turn-helix domain-containing protein [Paenibacillus taihuensis]REE69728.1 YesN/AraC family two-component response regulator [Paenibacillus taihuensis]